jgi:endonuclease YncB( thermonuclease family)
MWDRSARVLTVKDGDTLRVILNQGFGDTKTIDLRLFDTWAPEHDETGGAETRAFVVEWLDRNNPDGDEWPYVVTVKRVRAGTHEVTTLGRYVGALANAEGESLNDAVNGFVASKGYGRGIGAKA